MHDVRRRPDRATTEHRLTVHPEAETFTVVAVIDLDLPETRACKAMLRAVQLKNDVMQSWPAMRVWPPLFHISYAQFAGKCAAFV